MANENPSRENQSRQQSAERAQTGSMQQGTGSSGAGQAGTYGQGTSGQGTGTSTWQGGGSQQSGGALQRHGSSATPYSGYWGYGTGPFSMMRRISDEMDRLFESFGMGGLFPSVSKQGGARDVGGFGGTPSMWSPRIEVCERNGKLLIQADLPGMKRDDVNVRIEQDEVIIQGERRQDQSSSEGGYYRSERSYGSFYRTIPLPEGTNSESATATFRDGVLEIELDAPRQPPRGRTLEIREGASQAGYGSTGSGATYGSGTTGAMQGSTTGAGQQSASGGMGQTGSSGSQQSASGTQGSQYSSGSGTMYSGSGEPSAGATGMGSGSRSSPTSDEDTSGKSRM